MTLVTGSDPRDPDASGIVPIWLAHLGGLSWRLLAIGGLVLVAAVLAAQLIVATASVLLAAIIAATFAPWVLQLRSRGWSRTRAAGVVTLGAVLVIVGGGLLIALALAPDAVAVAQNFQVGIENLKQTLTDASVSPQVIDTIDQAQMNLQTWLSDNLQAIASSIATAFTILLLGVFLTFFFMLDGDRAWAAALASVGTRRRDKVMTSGHDALERVGGYLRGTAIIAGINASTDFVFMVVLGVPLAAPLAVFVFFGCFIPILGGIVTTTVLLLVAYAALGIQPVIVLLVLITIRNIILGNFVIPVVYGRTVKIHPALVLIALPAGAAVAGIIGLFAVIPVLAFCLSVAGAVTAVLDVEPSRRARSTYYMPAWLDHLAQWSWQILLALGVGIAAIEIAVLVPTVVGSVLLATIVAATFAPLQNALLRRGWGSARAALTTVLGVFAVITAILILTFATLIAQAEPIIDSAQQGAGTADASAGTTDALEKVVNSIGSGFLSNIAAIVSAAASLVVIVVLAILLSFFFLRDGPRWWATFTRRLSDWRRHEVDAAGTRSITVLGGYMIGTGVISAVGAVSQFAIMAILGIPLALPLAVLSFFGGYIPYIGSLITTGLAFLVTLAVGSTTDVIVMAIFTAVFNIVQGNVAAPLVYGRAVHIHPAIILIAIPAGGALAGVMGMFLVVPVIGIIAATWRTVLFVFGDAPAPDTTTGTPYPVESSPSGPATQQPPELGPATAT